MRTLISSIVIGRYVNVSHYTLDDHYTVLSMLCNSGLQLVEFTFMGNSLNLEIVRGKPVRLYRRPKNVIPYFVVEVRASDDPDVFIQREFSQTAIRAFTPLE